jgi:hypothetical protein
MLKDPVVDTLLISSIPLAQRPIGRFAICAQWSSNPKEEEIDPVLQDYSYMAPPLNTVLECSDASSEIDLLDETS